MLKIDNFKEIIVANWKLNGSFSFVEEYQQKIKLNDVNSENRCVIVCPPIPYINLFKSQNLFVGAQDCSADNEGAFTGEISAKILRDIGCNFCIIGHSERRNFYKENNQIIYKKLINCLNNNIIPIFCVGENLEQKKQNITKKIIKEQINYILLNIKKFENIIIAYEPVWAIGTGLIPSLDDIYLTHKFIRDEVIRKKNIKILYGGSVKENNSKKILDIQGVDGLLVGGASIDIEQFNKIIVF